MEHTYYVINAQTNELIGEALSSYSLEVPGLVEYGSQNYGRLVRLSYLSDDQKQTAATGKVQTVTLRTK